MIEEIFESYGISPIPENYTEAMAYVPFQSNDVKFYSIPHGFEVGTIFPSLNKPFYGQKCKGDDRK